MKQDLKKLRRKYEDACNEYLEIFCEKQGMENFGWVAGDVGEIALCSDFYFTMHDIKLDIDTKQQVGTIIKWYDDNMSTDEGINYYSYIKGLRIEDLKNGK